MTGCCPHSVNYDWFECRLVPVLGDVHFTNSYSQSEIRRCRSNTVTMESKVLKSKSKAVGGFLPILLLSVSTQTVVADEIIITDKFDTINFHELSSIPLGDSTKFANAQRCFDAQPKTRQGRWISAQEWAVTSEIEFSNYTFVSFHGQINIGTSGTCWRAQGNIAIFHGAELLGLVSSSESQDNQLGRLSLAEGGIIRVHSGDPSEIPVLDLRYTGDNFRLTELAAFTTYCEGQYVVPNVYNQDILEARNLIMQLGWMPSDQVISDGGFRADRIRGEGIQEVIACSGTGMGYCAFEYSLNDVNLLVTTIDPTRVSNVEVICSRE